MNIKHILSTNTFKFVIATAVAVLLLVLSFGLSINHVSGHGDHTAVDCSTTPATPTLQNVPGTDGSDPLADHDCVAASGTTTGTVDSAARTAACAGADLRLPDGTCPDDPEAGRDIQETIKQVLNIFSWIVGIASVIMIIYAGFKYVISQGGDGTAQARNTILYAVVGLVVVALAQAIVRFVIGSI